MQPTALITNNILQGCRKEVLKHLQGCPQKPTNIETFKMKPRLVIHTIHQLIVKYPNQIDLEDVCIASLIVPKDRNK